jgi:HlyD family secretion protein
MKKLFLNGKNYILKHRIISVMVLIVLVIIGYKTVQAFTASPSAPVYTFGQATRGTLISTVSGTGQVSASNQVDLKTQTSGNISYVNVKVGQAVRVGTLIAQIDSADATYELENAKLAYDKLVTVDPDTLRKDNNSVIQATADLNNSYVTARTSMSSSLSDMSDVDTGLKALFDFNTGYLTESNYLLNQTAKAYQTKAESSYYVFDGLLSELNTKYKNISLDISDSDIESLITDFYKVSLASAQAAKDAQDAVIYLMNNNSDKNQTKATSAYTSVVSLVSKANGVVSSVTSTKSTISNNKISLENAQVDLQTLKDLRSEQLTVNQKQEALNNYSVVAPFDGVIASSDNVNIGDTVSNGTTVATIITKEKVAQISLNEIDAAKVKVGQKVNLTFDAIDNLNITGTVYEINLIGTVSQGVVSYTVKISFDTQDDRVKSGMSVSASIITDAKVDVLMVPSSAIKTQGNISYVQILDASNAVPRQQIVIVGDSNDTSTEIVSGLNEGDSIITKTTVSTSATATKPAASITSLLGGNRRGN